MQYMSQGLPIAIIGYLMVFVVLCFLWVMLELMHFIIKSFSKENKNIKSDNTDINQYDDEPGADESELIAVFTAAIACSLNTSTYNLKIKSYKRTDCKNNVWSNASRNDAINNF